MLHSTLSKVSCSFKLSVVIHDKLINFNSNSPADSFTELVKKVYIDRLNTCFSKDDFMKLIDSNGMKGCEFIVKCYP
jgi:hypothetical protein